jgi:hypothetical protein
MRMFRKYEINVRGLQNKYSSHGPFPLRSRLGFIETLQCIHGKLAPLSHMHNYTITYAPTTPAHSSFNLLTKNKKNNGVKSTKLLGGGE